MNRKHLHTRFNLVSHDSAYLCVAVIVQMQRLASPNLCSCTVIATGRKGLARETSFNIPKTSCHHSSSKPSHPNLHHVTLLSLLPVEGSVRL